MNTEVTGYVTGRLASDKTDPGSMDFPVLSTASTRGQGTIVHSLRRAFDDAFAGQEWSERRVLGNMVGSFCSYTFAPHSVNSAVSRLLEDSWVNVDKYALAVHRTLAHRISAIVGDADTGHFRGSDSIGLTDDLLRLGEALFADDDPLPREAMEVLDGLVGRRRSLLEG